MTVKPEDIVVFKNPKTLGFFDFYTAQRQNKNSYQWTTDELIASIKSPQNQILVAQINGEVSSLLIFQHTNPQIEIIYLETQEKFRDNGLMKYLLSQLIQLYPKSPIWLDVHEDNKPALSLYKKLGFILNGQRKAYYRNGGTGLVLSRPVVLNL